MKASAVDFADWFIGQAAHDFTAGIGEALLDCWSVVGAYVLLGAVMWAVFRLRRA